MWKTLHKTHIKENWQNFLLIYFRYYMLGITNQLTNEKKSMKKVESRKWHSIFFPQLLHAEVWGRKCFTKVNSFKFYLWWPLTVAAIENCDAAIAYFYGIGIHKQYTCYKHCVRAHLIPFMTVKWIGNIIRQQQNIYMQFLVNAYKSTSLLDRAIN